MRQTKLKPSDIAAEAKRTYIPYIDQKLPQFPTKSLLHPDTTKLRIPSSDKSSSKRPRVAVIDGDPIDVALDWHEYNCRNSSRSNAARDHPAEPCIPVVNMANEKRAGGDWESGLIAQEENLCRRSNLVHCLTTPWTTSTQNPNYPIPTKGGIYSPNVVVFRSGPDKGYSVWKDFKCLPIISVAPVRRPKLDESATDYSFEQEKDLMKEKMRSVLRIAATYHHKDLCMGAFGAGSGFRNPVQQLATMWRDILFSEAEFQGAFTNIVFAIERSSGSSTSQELTDFDIFQQEFDPSNVFKTAYR